MYFISDDFSLSKKLKELGDPVRIFKFAQLYMIKLQMHSAVQIYLLAITFSSQNLKKKTLIRNSALCLLHISVLYLVFWVEKSTDYRKFIH